MARPAWLRGLEAGTSGGAVRTANWTSLLVWIFGLFATGAVALGLASLADSTVGVLGGLVVVLTFALLVSISANGVLQTALDRYERPTMVLTFDVADPNCHEESHYGPPNARRVNAEWYRARLTNLSGRSIES